MVVKEIETMSTSFLSTTMFCDNVENNFSSFPKSVYEGKRK